MSPFGTGRSHLGDDLHVLVLANCGIKLSAVLAFSFFVIVSDFGDNLGLLFTASAVACLCAHLGAGRILNNLPLIVGVGVCRLTVAGNESEDNQADKQ